MEPSGAPWRVLETAEPAAQAEAMPQARPVPWTLIAAAVAVVAIAVAGAVIAFRPDPLTGVDGAGAFAADAALAGDLPSPPGGEATGGLIVVDVSGAVSRPGVYRLPAGSRVGDAIAAAGGYGSGVDAALADRQLNLAAVLADGEKVRIPVRGDAPSSPAESIAGGGSATGLVDLNHASADALDTLPGVGPATVAKIIAAREERPFASIDELTSRKVVGAATLEKLRSLVSVGP